MPADGDLDVLLVRHGESTWNADGRWQGQADPPLTERGREQARAAAGGLPGTVHQVVASDLDRARVTAEVLAAAADAGLVVRIDAAFRERDAGAFSGLDRAEIHERYPGLLPDDPVRRPDDGDGLIPPPGWELDSALSERAWGALARLAARLEADGTTTALVVTHSGLIYAVERDLGVRRERIANLEGRWLHRRGGRWEAGERLLLLDPTTTTVTSPDQL